MALILQKTATRSRTMSQTATCELVYSSSLDDLSDAVTNRMVDGWWPLGRPFTRGEHFIQAMVFEPRIDDRSGSTEDN
jgi:hypothetical protein